MDNQANQIDGRLDSYAALIVKVGLNLQPGQRLLIGTLTAPVPFEAAPLIRRIAEHAYRLGSPLVQVQYGDDGMFPLRLRHAAAGTLDAFPEWIVRGYEAELKAGAALLSIAGGDPDLLAGQDPAGVDTMMGALIRGARPVLDLVTSNVINWLVAAAPTRAWAQRVFPDLPAGAAVDRLWELVFAACRIDQPDPIAAWETHLSGLAERSAELTRKQFDALHYRGPGTDLTVGLPAGHIWEGGRACTQSGQAFCPNLPTEEAFTLPHKDRIDGVVSSTRPFSYTGETIEGARLTFSGGRVTHAEADRGGERLQQILAMDAGAAGLGEVALVPNSSPVSQAGVIFRSILFDENASCHFALGDAYRNCLQGGVDLSEDEFHARGGNTSDVHLDFMVGSGDLDIDGLYAGGRREPVMRRGEWV